jgi:hypothetical protein
VSNGNVRTDAGLIVPASAVTKKSRCLAPDTMRRIRRLTELLGAEQIGALFVCKDCETPIAAMVVDQVQDVIGDLHGGRVVLVCKCSSRSER